jgi:predicted nuclease of predicted toxin-antitoxin system
VKILFDHCVPRPLRNHFPGHDVRTTYECGWAEQTNGELLTAAEADGFEVLLTTDRNLQYQQTMRDRKIAVLVLVARTNRVPELLPLVPQALTGLISISPCEIVRVESPFGEPHFP